MTQRLIRSATIVALLLLAARAEAQTALTAGDEQTLRNAIFQASNDFADDGLVQGGPYTITLTASITLTKSLPMIRTDMPGGGGPGITIDGAGVTIDANSSGRVFFVESGRVLIQDVTIINAFARGGNAGNAANSSGGGGGGGLGAGAAIFVDDDADVTLRDVIVSDAASAGGHGGNGGSGSGPEFGTGGGGGGGLGGDAGSARGGSVCLCSILGGGGGGGGGGYAGNGAERFGVSSVSMTGSGGGGGGGEFGGGGTVFFAGGGGGGGQQGNGGGAGGGFLAGMFLVSAGGGGGGRTAHGASGNFNPRTPFGGAGGGAEGGAGGNDQAPGANALAAFGGGGGGGLGRPGGAGLASGGGGGGGGAGGAGGIGGGGGGGHISHGGAGGRFGGGGGTGSFFGSASAHEGGAGGYGGGGGGARADANHTGGAGGFGAGGGGAFHAGAGGPFGGTGGAGLGADGGGGAALGGAVFLGAGGALTLENTEFTGMFAVTAGSAGPESTGGATDGEAHGALAFLVTGTTLVNNVAAGNTRTLPEAIAGDGGLAKAGAGTLVLTGNNVYTGATTVSAGVLRVNGTQTASAITVQNGGTLQGGGTVGMVSVQSGGTLAPGLSPGTINTQSLSLVSGAIFAVEINGTTAGSQYDQTHVTGTVSLGGATLNLSVGFTLAGLQTFAILVNDESDAVSGTFNGVAEGGTLAAAGRTFRISYTGGTGNDVVLTVVNDMPTIADLLDQTIVEGAATGALPFMIADSDTAAASLILSATSSNTTIVPTGNIVFGGAGANRTVTVTPAANQLGMSLITVTVSDGVGSASDTFTLTVVAPPPPPVANQAPTLGGVVDATIEESKTLTLTLTVDDAETPAGNLIVTANSSNAALLPASGVVLGGAAATRTLALTPMVEATGQTTLTVTVSDGALTTVRTALLAVVASPPPQPPTRLTASALGTDVTLTWVESPLGATPTFFVLDGGTAPGVTTLPVMVTPTRVAQWTLRLPAGVYFFRVRAANRAGTSDRSNEATVFVSSPTPLPGPPTGMAAVVNGVHVTLGWLRPAVGGTPDLWRLEFGSAAGAIDRGVFGVASEVTAVGADLAAGEYFARVRGVNGAGPGPASNEARFRVGEVPACDAPEAPVLLPATINGRFVTVSWRASRNAAVGTYRLLVGSLPGASDLAILDVGPVTSFVAAAPPGRYNITLIATNNCGTSTPSNPIEVIVSATDATPAPANLRAVINGHQVTLAWDTVTGATSYLLEAGYAPGLTNAVTVPVGATGLTVDGVPSGTYYVRVRAVGGGVLSAPSGEIVVIVP